MKFHISIIFLMILSTFSCEFQTFSGPELDEEKMEYANYYFSLLEAEAIELNPLDHDWEDDDLPILITNSKLIQIGEDNQLSNVAVADTLASFLWNAVKNKEKYTRIRIGFVQSTTDGIVEEAKFQWLDYPTNILK